MNLRIGVLGPLEVSLDGRPLHIPGGRQRAVLTALVLARPGVLGVDRLAALIVPGAAGADARNAAQTYVARLRRSLGAAAGCVRTAPPGYVLDAPAVDAERFTALAAPRPGETALDALLRLDAALDLWRGPAYAEFPDLARAESARLAELRRDVEETRVEVLAGLGRTAEAVAAASALVAADPGRDRAVRALVTALAAAGRTADALDAVRAHRVWLRDEAGLDPSRALLALQAELLRDPTATEGPERTTRPGKRMGHEVSPRSEPAAAPDGPMVGRTGTAPPRAPELIGRDRELAEVTALLTAGRIVTLIGPGGVGKTSLALACARPPSDDLRGDDLRGGDLHGGDLHGGDLHGGDLRSGDLHDGELRSGYQRGGDQRVGGPAGGGDPRGSGAAAWWVDLAALGDQAAVAPAVAAAVGLVVEGRVVESLTAWARGADGLLVIDNCEHLLDAVHELLGGMLVEDCPGLRVLATSRERIGLAGERCYVVDPLSADAAVRLFTARAAATGTVTGPDGGSDRVAALCSALDRLPLAIELAAARVGALTVDDLARRLDARLVLLDAGPRGRPARHQTLRAVVDWSWRLLGERERIAFARLHVFAAGIDLDAAEAVIGYGELTAAEVAHVVALLAERSLLTRPGTVGVGRYRMLVSLRVYAAELLDEAGDRELRLRHATYFAGVLEEASAGLSGPDEAAWVPVIEGALDDARQAWQWSRAHAPPVAVRIAGAAAEFGFWRLRADLLTWSTLILPDAGSQAAVLVGAAYGAWLDGDFGTAARIAQGAVDAGHAGAADQLGDIALIQGDLDGAEAHYRQAIAVLPVGTPARAVAMANLALPLAYRQDPAALPAAEAGLVEARATGNPSALAFAMFALAEAHGDGDPTAAIGALDQALRLADSVGNRFVAGVTRTAMVALRGRHGPPGPALALFAGAIRHWRTTGGRPLLIIALRNLVVLFARTGRDVAAIELAAALDAPSGVYGAEAERLAQALGAVRVRLPVTTAEEAWRRGSTRSADEAAAEALRHLP
ncbi:AfsR/SARP family transcriptional regulator [Dactylosporangium siamense]|uniref:AfsR/SARP family transcriptional regulator n=2 Tax=Dactylosporangium siamense TaxID=685454 RepID=UPI002FED9F60